MVNSKRIFDLYQNDYINYEEEEEEKRKIMNDLNS